MIYDDELVRRFNRREPDAFGEVYSLIFNELHYFTATLSPDGAVDSSDLIHDAFLNLWQLRNQTFDGISNIKAYLYVSIRNLFKNHIIRKKYSQNYKDKILRGDDFVVDVAESELYAQVQEVFGFLPEECNRIFRLILEGWSVEEIAEITGKKPQSIYNIKHKIITTLREKLNPHALRTILFLMN